MSMANDAIKAVFDAAKRDEGINTSTGVRALANAMFTLCRCSDEYTDQQLIDNLAFLTGMASAALLDYAKMLEEEGQ